MPAPGWAGAFLSRLTHGGGRLRCPTLSLKLYVKAWCPWCIDAKHFLDKRGYVYEELDVERDQAAYEDMMRLSGQAYTPTLVAGEKVLADFGPPDLEKFLKKNSLLP